MERYIGVVTQNLKYKTATKTVGDFFGGNCLAKCLRVGIHAEQHELVGTMVVLFDRGKTRNGANRPRFQFGENQKIRN